MGHRPLHHLALALVGLAMLSTGVQAAAPATVTLVQMHPAIGVGEEVFMYAVAKQMGYFKDEGLDVSIEGVAGGGAAVQALQSGEGQFATTMPESILQMRERGGDPVAIYTLKQNTGSVVIVPEDSPIHTLADLKGRTVGAASFGAGGGLAVKEQLGRLGISPGQYTAVTTGVNAAAFTSLQTHQIDALVVWDSMRGAAENTGMKIRAVEIPDQDKVGAMTLATTDDYAKAHPDIVAGMCRAVAKGLRFSLANPSAAIRLFWREFPAAKPSLPEATALQQQRHIMDRWFEMAEQGIAPGHETGAIRPDTWAMSARMYTASGTLKGSNPVAQAYSTAFTDRCNDYDRAAVDAQAAAGGPAAAAD